MEDDIYNIYITFPQGDVFMSDAYTDRHIAEILFSEIRIDDQIRSARLDVFIVSKGIKTTIASK